MDEFHIRFQPQGGESFFEEILHGFHVVVGPGLDFLDAGGVFGREIAVDGPKGGETGRIHFRELGKREFAQGDEILHFHEDAVAHQGIFRKECGKFSRLGGIAPVDGRDGQQGIHIITCV